MNYSVVCNKQQAATEQHDYNTQGNPSQNLAEILVL